MQQTKHLITIESTESLIKMSNITKVFYCQLPYKVIVTLMHAHFNHVRFSIGIIHFSCITIVLRYLTQQNLSQFFFRLKEITSLTQMWEITHLPLHKTLVHSFYNYIHHMIYMKSYKCLDNENLAEMIKYNSIYTKGLTTFFMNDARVYSIARVKLQL